MPADYLEFQRKARQQYDAAFHLLKVTFPLVKDPRLLLGIVHNIVQAMEHAIDAVLAYERQLHRIPAYGNDFLSKYNLFLYKCVPQHKIEKEHLHLINSLREILELHKKSPMEFQRGGRFVICGRDYRLKSISAADLQQYLEQSRQFLEKMERIVAATA